MKRLIMASTAALAFAACGDGTTSPVSPDGTAPSLATGPSGPKYTVFTSQTPAGTVSATGGWEVATRFKASEPGRIVGFRFWRGTGESGTNVGRLWTNGGTLLRSASFPNSGRAGWDTVTFASNQPRLAANTYFRVSVNTNAYQAKTFGSSAFSITNGPLTGDLSYYGQPTGSMPTTGSYSLFFVDVIFIPDGNIPNLYVHSITRGTSGLDETVTIRVCNNGAATAAASTLRMDHSYFLFADVRDLATPSLAVGACTNLTPDVLGEASAPHSYHVWADTNDVIYESNEGDNELSI
jgi:hypothetical protein